MSQLSLHPPKTSAIATKVAGNPEEATRQKSHSWLVIKIALNCAVLSIAIYLVGLYAGQQISHAEHSDNPNQLHFMIAGDQISLPANIVRYPNQRNTQIPERLDLYLHWPSMKGFEEALAEKFNNMNDRSEIIFATIEKRFSTLDMSARFEPVYSRFISKSSPIVKRFGLQQFTIDASSGFIDEYLLVEENKSAPFTVRCTKISNQTAIPYCIRDIHLGENLVLTYRFHEKQLSHWREIEKAMRIKFRVLQS